MKSNPLPKEELRLEAESLHAMINALTLFSRRTTVEWLPEIVSKTGISREHITVMFELSIEPKQSLKQLSHNIMAAAPNVSVMVQSMVEDGVVHRAADPKDRRRVLLSLSEKGQRLFRNAQAYLLERYIEYLRDLHDADRKDLHQAAQSMLMVMERILDRRFGDKKQSSPKNESIE